MYVTNSAMARSRPCPGLYYSDCPARTRTFIASSTAEVLSIYPPLSEHQFILHLPHFLNSLIAIDAAPVGMGGMDCAPVMVQFAQQQYDWREKLGDAAAVCRWKHSRSKSADSQSRAAGGLKKSMRLTVVGMVARAQ